MKKNSPFAWLAGLLLAVTMAFGLATPAQAATNIQADAQATITVNGVEQRTKADVYKIIDVHWDTEGQAFKTPAYTWNGNITDWLYTNGYGNYVANGNEVSKYYTESEDNHVDAEFFDKLFAALKSGKITGVDYTTQDSGDTTTLTYKQGMGGYLLHVNNSQKYVYQTMGYNVAPTLNSKNEYVLNDITPEIKRDPLDIKKTSNEKTVVGAQYGDEIPFDVVADVPGLPENARDKTFQIADTFDEGLTYHGGVEVYGLVGTEKNTDHKLDGKFYTLRDGDKTVTASGNPATFVVDLNWDEVHKAGYDHIYVKYSGTLNSKAKVGQVTKNSVRLIWAQDPYNENGGYNEIDPSVLIYTYGIEILKTDDAAYFPNAVKLSGAKFTIANKADSSNSIKFVKISDGQYKVYDNVVDKGATTVTEVEVDSNGGLLISGLNEGTYVITETVPPTGYNKPSKPFEVTITAVKDDAGNPTERAEGDNKYGYVWQQIQNTKGFQLPKTGGAGTVAITAAGVMVMAGAGFVLLRGRKNN